MLDKAAYEKRNKYNDGVKVKTLEFKHRRGFEVEDIRLIYKGKLLQENLSLEENNIQNGYSMYLLVYHHKECMKALELGKK